MGKKKKQNVSFEEKLTALQALVDNLEREETPLEALIEGAKKGKQLIEECQAQLNLLEMQIQYLDNPPNQATKDISCA